MKLSDQCDKVLPALLKLQQMVKEPQKNATNVLTKDGRTARYATLDTFVDAIKPIANELGLIISQEGMTADNNIRIATMFIHAESGQYVLFDGFPVSSVGLTAQQVAAATTYLRRYGLSSALALIADEDDDGKSASAPAQSKPIQAPKVEQEFTVKSKLPKGKYQGKSLEDIVAIGDMSYVVWFSEKWQDADERQVAVEYLMRLRG